MKAYIKNFTQNPKNDILSGLTVALALVPEAVAFAFVAGIDPLVGLYGAFMMGIVTALFGGRPGMISGATGAMAVVMVHLIKEGNAVGVEMGMADSYLGLQWLFITLLLVGTIQILAGLFKLGKFVRLIPHPVMMGFVNGLAIVIFLSQLGMFKENIPDQFGNNLKETENIEVIYQIQDDKITDITTGFALFHVEGDEIIDNTNNETAFLISDNQVFDAESKQVKFAIEDNAIYSIEIQGDAKKWINKDQLLLMVLLILPTMGIMFFLPKLTKKIPSALVAIIVVAGIVIIGKLDVSTVGSFIRDGGGANGLKGELPQFQSQIFGLFSSIKGHWSLIISTAVILAAVGLIESLMTLNLIDDLTESRGSGNKECVAQGSANILNGLFGGMGGCAMIGQSIINVESGGRGRLSGAVAALALLGFILFGAPVIEQIPIAALVGVMFMVVFGTFAWSSFRILHKIPLADTIVLIAVSAITVWMDLAVAVIAGVIISALVFAWKNATMIRARKRIKEDGTKVYEIWGPLFFGSTQEFANKFTPKTDPQKIEIDFIESKVADHSAVEALKNLADKYLDLDKEVKLVHLSQECKDILLKANPKFENVIEHAIDDPRYHVVSDYADQEV